MREKKTIRHYLWVRIFFIVLITVLIIMTLFIAAWQKNTINYLFQSEEKKIIQNQEYISDALERALSLKILSEGTEELSDEQIQSAVQSALYYNVGEIVLFRDSNIIGSNNWERETRIRNCWKKTWHLMNVISDIIRRRTEDMSGRYRQSIFLIKSTK